MRFDSAWTDAAAAHLARHPAQPAKPIPAYRVCPFQRVRPLFTAETEWPWPDGLYFAIEAPDGRRLAREFANGIDADRFCASLNQLAKRKEVFPPPSLPCPRRLTHELTSFYLACLDWCAGNGVPDFTDSENLCDQLADLRTAGLSAAAACQRVFSPPE